MVIYARSSLIPLTFPHFGLIKTVNNQSMGVCRREGECVCVCAVFEMSQWKNVPITLQEN